MKTFLFVFRKAPHSGAYSQEFLDIILTTAAFDQPVSLLLLDDGVFQLKKNQHAKTGGYKDTAAIFNALEIYEVTTLFVEIESMLERGLTSDDLFLPVQEVTRKEVAALMKRFDVIVAG